MAERYFLSVSSAVQVYAEYGGSQGVDKEECRQVFYSCACTEHGQKTNVWSQGDCKEQGDDEVRHACGQQIARRDSCACFSGSDESGYKYIISSNTVDLRAKTKEINAAIGGKGGGSSEMIQGSCAAKRADIEKYFTLI